MKNRTSLLGGTAEQYLISTSYIIYGLIETHRSYTFNKKYIEYLHEKLY